jgi:hypothetical protein
MTKQEQRIKRLKNRIRSISARLRICDSAHFAGVAGELQRIVGACYKENGPCDLVDAVEDFLDERIEPKSPIAEWLSDIAIDIAAAVAVDIWNGTARRLEARLARAKAKLARLEAAA